MAFSAGSAAFQARRQALINLALKRDPIPLRQKPAVSFIDDGSDGHAHMDELPSANGLVNELPPLGTQYSIRYPSQVIVDELPLASPTIKTTSARSLYSMSPIS